MNSITMNGVAMRNGELVHATRELTKMSDGTWRTTKFGDALLDAIDSGKSDTYEPEPTTRKKLTDRELAELADKYDPRNMTQDQYDAFLDELVEKGALSRSDRSWLGYKGFTRLDCDPENFAGPELSNVTSVGNSDDDLIQSLQDADGDLIRWLESMMARQDQWTGPSSREKAKTLDTLYDIIKRM